jgi:hypothetical protein
MTREPLQMLMPDDSRYFGALPQTVMWDAVHAHIARLPGAAVTAYVTDHLTEAWIDFTYRGYAFSINDQLGDYWFFVDHPACPDALLGDVLAHFCQICVTEC